MRAAFIAWALSMMLRRAARSVVWISRKWVIVLVFRLFSSKPRRAGRVKGGSGFPREGKAVRSNES